MLSTSRGSGLGNGKSNGDGSSESRLSAAASGPGSRRVWRAEIGRRIGAAQAMATVRRRRSDR